MRQGHVLLLALVGAFFLAGSLAAPTPRGKPATASNDYVRVKLVFNGAEQTNFDKWHANATAAALAVAAGVPVSYVTRMPDGKLPVPAKPDAAEKKPTTTQPAATVAPASLTTSAQQTQTATTAPAAAATTKPAAAATPTPAAPTATPTTAPAAAAAAPAPAAAAPVATGPVVTVIPGPTAAPAITTTGTTPGVSLIADGSSNKASAVSQDKAAKTTPESGSAELAAPVVVVTHNNNNNQLMQQQTAEGTGNAQRTQFFWFGRRLMAAPQPTAVAEFAIKTNASEPWAVKETVKRKLMASAAGFGMASGTSMKGFYTLLKEHGVTSYPSMWVDGAQILSGPVAMDAPANRFANTTKTGGRNFNHKLFNPSDLKPKSAAENVTVAEPSYVMANRSTAPVGAASPAGETRRGMPAWVSALIALGTVAFVVAAAASFWRCAKDRRARREAEEQMSEDAQQEPLSPSSVAASHEERA